MTWKPTGKLKEWKDWTIIDSQREENQVAIRLNKCDVLNGQI